MSSAGDDLFSDHIPLLKPWIEEDEVEAVSQVLRSGWIAQGPKVQEFENLVSDYLGCPHCVATNSATSALHLALRVSGIGYGDRVVAPSHTCVATLNAIHQCGATPVFADIDPRTYNLAPSAVEQVLSAEVRGILVVDQIGMPADIDTFVDLAEKHDLILVEDAATAFGASYKGKRLGSLGPPTAFSFHPRKMITTGEGGMVTTFDRKASERCRQLRSAGASISDLDRHKARGKLVQAYYEYGYNFRMTDLQGALGVVQIKRIESILEQRHSQAATYNRAFADIEEIETPYVPPYASPAFSSYLIRLAGRASQLRDEVVSELALIGVSSRVGIQPAHREPMYGDQYEKLDLPNTDAAARETMFLPIFPGMTEEQQTRVSTAVVKTVARLSRRGRG